MSMKTTILFSGKALFMRVAILAALVIGGGNSAWGDTVIKTIDFSKSEWSDVTFTQGNTTTPDVHNGVTFYSKSSSNHFSLSGGVLTFPESNMGTSNYALGFPVTGIVGGIVILKVYNGTGASQVTYAIKDGGTEFNTDDLASKADALTYGTPCTIINTGLSNTQAYIYIGRKSSSYKTITKIEVSTIAMTDISESAFYQFYKTSYTSPANLISGASLPSYVVTDIGTYESTASNSSSISSPHDFTGLASASASTYYYRLKASNTNTIAIGALSHVKSIRLYGNGSGNDGTINIAVKKVSGDGTAMTIAGVVYDNSQKSVVEYSTGDLSALDGYDSNTYYFYTITFSGKSKSTTNFSLWGLYIEYNAPSSFTVTYDNNGGSGSIANSTGASITLSDGTGFTAPSGYTFAGWNTDAHGTGTSYTSGQENVKADLDLYAVWTQNGTISGNGGTADGAYTATYNKAAIAITTAPTNAGYAVNGYYEAGTGDALVASTAGALEASTSYTDASGYWTHTGSAPTLYAQWANTHELTVSANNALMGSAVAEETTLTEGATTEVTAAAETGYKFRSWSVSGTGAELSSTTDNPTTFTMGTADATVIANFSALETYTITYSKGANGTGDAIADGVKTEDADFTLSSSTYTYANHLQTGWATSDGGDKAYDLGGTYTGNADLTLYPYWIEQYTLTYDANGGTGSMSDVEGTGSITLTANAFTKTGYTFLGWATSQDNADAHTVAYADKAAYTLSETTTLYAVWGENFFTFTPSKTSGSLSADEVVTTTAGGVMDVVDPTSLSYTSSGLNLGANNSKLRVVLYDYLKAGSVILVKVYFSTGTIGRGVKLYNSSDEKSQNLTGTSATTVTLQYTVTENDGFVGTNEFHIMRTNGVYLQSLTVTDCQPGGVISASGWNTYSSNKALDLSTISGGTAYIAAEVNGSANSVRLKECTDIVSAGTGLMIKGTKDATFTINAATGSEATLSETNLMVGLPNGGTAPTGSYVFGWPTETPANCGFYYINSTEPTLGAGKAYLSSPSPSGARLTITFDDDDTTTGIASVAGNGQNTDRYFNLQGQQVTNPVKGIYIVNGKKVVNNR